MKENAAETTRNQVIADKVPTVQMPRSSQRRGNAPLRAIVSACDFQSATEDTEGHGRKRQVPQVGPLYQRQQQTLFGPSPASLHWKACESKGQRVRQTQELTCHSECFHIFLC